MSDSLIAGTNGFRIASFAHAFLNCLNSSGRSADTIDPLISTKAHCCKEQTIP